MKLNLPHWAVLLAVCSPLLLVSCAGQDAAEEEIPPEIIYNEGLELRDAGELAAASEKFEQVETIHPYSPYAKKALINLAYINYQRKRYPEAITSAERFSTLYPGSADTAYALYIVGNANFNQIQDVTRDQDTTKKAFEAFNNLMQQYPDSEYVEDSRQKARVAQDQLAAKEMLTGRYYLQRRNFVAAINRFRIVIEEHQTTRHVEEALARTCEAFYSLGVVSEAQTAAAVLGHNFPESEWYTDTYALLQSGGFEPAEDSGSWISKAFDTINPL